MPVTRFERRVLRTTFGLLDGPHKWTKHKWGALCANGEVGDDVRDPNIRRRCLAFAIDTAIARQRLRGALRRRAEERVYAIVAAEIRSRSKVDWARDYTLTKDPFDRDVATIIEWNDARHRRHAHVAAVGESVLAA